jgi:hypothetical protein
MRGGRGVVVVVMGKGRGVFDGWWEVVRGGDEVRGLRLGVGGGGPGFGGGMVYHGWMGWWEDGRFGGATHIIVFSRLCSPWILFLVFRRWSAK